tara:strand:+ start:162 stop:533 length:372 start_codon:yes stop_codon:yes gene_type:complete
MDHQTTIYLQKCASCKSKNLVPEFGTSGQLVCQQCGMVGYTEEYSTQDIDELADMLKNVKTEDVPMEQDDEKLPEVIQEMLMEYELEKAMEEAEKTDEQLLEEQLEKMNFQQNLPSRRSYRRY